jgi:hypothetical protein
LAELRLAAPWRGRIFRKLRLGIQTEGDQLCTEGLHVVPDTLPSGTGFDILLYHYQPKGGLSPNTKLELTVGPDIDVVVPPDIFVDSRYDLKSWSCRTTANTQITQKSWIRIRTGDAWDLDIAVCVAGAWLRWVLRAVVTGILIAVPSIAAVAPQTLPTDQKHMLYGVSIVFGFLAGLVATYKIERLD